MEQCNFSSLPQYFNTSLTSGLKLYTHLLNVVVRFIVFLNSANLICRGTDISKCFRESIGIRDNEGQLYVNIQRFYKRTANVLVRLRIGAAQDAMGFCCQRTLGCHIFIC